MNCKSIRLDFSVSGLGINDNELLVLLQDALLHVATADASHGNVSHQRREAAKVLSQAVSEAHVDSYDDRYGSPVFYIP